jgi:hypothetical protein
MSVPWPPNPRETGPPPRGPDPGHSGPEAAPCARCGHRARLHHDPGSRSARGLWWRRCRCIGFIGVDADTAAE